MKPSLVLLLTAVGFIACVKPVPQEIDHRKAVYERAVSETRAALKYPDASEFPPMDTEMFTMRADTVTILFDVMAANAYGTKKKAMTLLTFRVDSCEHLVRGWVVDDVAVNPDPSDRPCSPAAIIRWEHAQDEKRAAQQKEEMRLLAEDSAYYSSIPGLSVTRVEGKEKYGGRTSVSYSSIATLLSDVRARGAKTMEAPELTQSLISAYKSASSGGSVDLKVERGTIGAVSAEWFTIIVHDSLDREVLRETPERSSAHYSDGDWWNLYGVSIPERIRPPFDIYIVDALGDTPFKYRVTATALR